MGLSSQPTPVLLAASGESWETEALRRFPGGGVVVVKRCVDLPDLVGTAATGTASVAVVSGALSGLDAETVVRLLRHDVRCVAVGGDPEVLSRLGVVHCHSADDPEGLSEAVLAAGAQALVADPEPAEVPVRPTRSTPGRVVAVHGPAGAPGRTSIAISIASWHARSQPTVLVDADPHGGTVAQQLGVLDEMSGLLAAARAVNQGTLTPEGFARCRRRLGGHGGRLELLTGLPRPDRWVEVRPGALDVLIEEAASVGDVVVDTGFSLEDDGDLGRSLARNQLTLDALARADHVVAVGSAEPHGLARLARTLVELRELLVPGVPVTVVVNRMRDALGWSRRDVLGMVEAYLRPHRVVFVPDDRAVADRALVAGGALVDQGEGPLPRALVEVHDSVWEPAAVSSPSAGRGRWRYRRP